MGKKRIESYKAGMLDVYKELKDYGFNYRGNQFEYPKEGELDDEQYAKGKIVAMELILFRVIDSLSRIHKIKL